MDSEDVESERDDFEEPGKEVPTFSIELSAFNKLKFEHEQDTLADDAVKQSALKTISSMVDESLQVLKYNAELAKTRILSDKISLADVEEQIAVIHWDLSLPNRTNTVDISDDAFQLMFKVVQQSRETKKAYDEFVGAASKVQLDKATEREKAGDIDADGAEQDPRTSEAMSEMLRDPNIRSQLIHDAMISLQGEQATVLFPSRGTRPSAEAKRKPNGSGSVNNNKYKNGSPKAISRSSPSAAAMRKLLTNGQAEEEDDDEEDGSDDSGSGEEDEEDPAPIAVAVKRSQLPNRGRGRGQRRK